MSDVGDALGTAIEGGLYSRAVEPRAGETKDGHTQETACLNCGTELIGSHCHACGQHAHVHRTIGAFLHDLLHGVLHADGKTLRTLPLLAWKPGELTRRYIDGQRARFVSPMALFLFAVFLMFAVFQLAGISPPTDFNTSPAIDVAASNPEQAEKDLAALREARASLADDNPAAIFLDDRIAALEKKVAASPATPAQPADTQAEPEADGADIVTTSLAKKEIDTGIPLINRGIEKWQKNPSLMAYKLQSNSYKFSWLLIPLSVPFVWLLFLWRRRFGVYDHSVFVTYSLAFMTLFYVLLVLLGGLGVSGETLGIVGVTIPPIHIYRQLKGAYGLTRFSALWRTVVLCAFIFVILFMFVDVLLVLGAVG